MDKNDFKIEEVASKTGLTKRTLRYYEDIGLVNPIRAGSGYRMYSEEEIEKIKRIVDIKESLGFNLNEIKSILELENDLKQILDNNIYDTEMIEKCLNEVKRQIKLIEDKEITLKRAKSRFNEVLSKLTAFHHD